MQAFYDGSGSHLGRRVKIDYSQSAQGGGSKGGGRSSNDGTRDIANSQTPVVLLRGLDPISTLDLIADALKASSGAAGQGAIGMKRIVLIRDRYTAMGIGLAFVEFVDADVSVFTQRRESHSKSLAFRFLVCRQTSWCDHVTRPSSRRIQDLQSPSSRVFW